ncbi:MAG: recombinase family protein [Planctomycetota bacterium]|jgi:DNA invertase Pin-like site-specific DNA recombinase
MMKKLTALYVRVSTQDKQTKGLKSQEEALQEYCKNHNITNTKVYRDTMTGGTLERPALQQLKQDIFVGKVGAVVVWKLDRLSRSLKDGINLLVDWLEKDIRVVAVSQQFDFSGSVGQLIASVLLGIGQMERQNIRENIARGMRAAKERGVKIGGSKPKISSDEVVQLKQQGMNISQIAKRLDCSRQTVYTALQRAEQ